MAPHVGDPGSRLKRSAARHSVVYSIAQRSPRQAWRMLRRSDARVQGYGILGPEASVWVAESEDVPGLVTEANTVEQLVTKLRTMVPELLEVNSVLSADSEDVPIQLFAKRSL